jgi:pimeloyl-ACP methyl ester carboxylesterase
VKLEANGLSFNVVVEGEGPAVLMLHGFPDSSRLWRGQIPALVGDGYQVIAPDLRGFGETSRPEEVEAYSLINTLGDLESILDQLDVKDAHVVGHDWGAGTAWVFASIFKARTKSLTALSVGHPGALRTAGLEQLQKSWYMMFFQYEGVAEELLTRDDWAFARQWLGDHGDPEHYLADLSRPGALTAALNWYRANVTPESWVAGPPRLPPVEVPTMGVWSTRDFALTEKQMIDSTRFVTGPWRYERIEDVGHWIPLEAPDRLAELLLDFLNSIDRRPRA